MPKINASPAEIKDLAQIISNYLVEYPLNQEERLNERGDIWQGVVELGETIQKNHTPEKDRYQRYTSDSTIYNYFLKKGLRPREASEMVVWVHRYYPTFTMISKSLLDKAQQAFRRADQETFRELALLDQYDKAFQWFERDKERSSKDGALALLERNLSRIDGDEIKAPLIRNLYAQKLEAIKNDLPTDEIDIQLEDLHHLYGRLDKRTR